MDLFACGFKAKDKIIRIIWDYLYNYKRVVGKPRLLFCFTAWWKMIYLLSSSVVSDKAAKLPEGYNSQPSSLVVKLGMQ